MEVKVKSSFFPLSMCKKQQAKIKKEKKRRDKR